MSILLMTLLAAGATVLAALSARRQQALLTDPIYGCLTRQGIERQWRGNQHVLFLDIDGMHQANTALGYDEVNRRIRTALRVCRAGEAAAGRWFSGDEIVVLAPTCAIAAQIRQRLIAALLNEGMSATFAIAAPHGSLAETVALAASVVQGMKARREYAHGRPTIVH